MNVVEKINLILKKANISKVNLAKYLGVSRQMVYNYLDSTDLSKLPNEKCQLLFELLNVKSADEILALEINKEYLQTVGSRIFDSAKEEEKKEKYYDCSFTRTYRVVDLLDGYVAEVPEESYVVLDAFLDHGAFTHRISSELKKKLEVNKYYEFTYTLKGIGIVNDIEDVRNRVSAFNSMKSDNSLKVLLEIKETDRVGLGQLQEKICEGK